MYCSRRGREVSRPTDTCKRCGRCNWEQQKSGKSGFAPAIAAIVLLAAVLFLMFRAM